MNGDLRIQVVSVNLDVRKVAMRVVRSVPRDQAVAARCGGGAVIASNAVMSNAGNDYAAVAVTQCTP